ncbi:MAG: glycosyltransferase family 2 protein [Limnothrix sp. CACIAM 69d]|nr:MAG: glycosyltransferase family 2 protein [Limnothrix sp. CACIAM 69d]
MTEPLLDRDALDRTTAKSGDQWDWSGGLEGRRRKAATALFALWSTVVMLHYAAWGPAFVWVVTVLAGAYVLRVMAAPQAAVTARSTDQRAVIAPDVSRSPVALAAEAWPSVAVLVSAKDEEAVIGALVKRLCAIDYPADHYEVWIIDDGSSDRTPQVLQQLQTVYPQLRVLRRPPGAGGGKSGALNAAVAQARGEILVVFDADAQMQPDLLRQVVPVFARSSVGAVQLRKAIVQAEALDFHPDRDNFWIRGQQAEMALDSHLQGQRARLGGVGELRGNGEFIRRAALEQCGGFNEATITDDLDLAVRLHLNGWDIECLMFPAVLEEGVTRLKALWHQRNRWAEGGYQRYLDYWRAIAGNRGGAAKTLDLAVFLLFQYLVPQMIVADWVVAGIRGDGPVLTPLATAGLLLSALGMVLGLRLVAAGTESPTHWGDRLVSWLRTLSKTALGLVYMLHWFPVIASMGLRIAVRPKQLKWVKTAHAGSGELAIELDDLDSDHS